MKLNVTFGSALCYCPEFEINGIDAEISDFGRQSDEDPDGAEDYACGDMQFIPHHEPPNGLLEKYGITVEEFREIGEKLRGG